MGRPAAIGASNIAAYTLGACDCPGCCTNISAPANGHLGLCESTGYLEHGSTCDLSCDAGWQPVVGSITMRCPEPGLFLASGGHDQIQCESCETVSTVTFSSQVCPAPC